MSRNSIRVHVGRAMLLCLALGWSTSALAQEPAGPEEAQKGPDATELTRQIRRNMIKIEDDLEKIGKHDASRGEQVKEDIDRLIDSMKQRQEQVVKDIDDVVKQFKKCGNGGGGKSDSNENQKNSKARDRNKPSKPRDQNQAEGKKPEGKQGKKPSGGQEDNTAKAQKDGQNLPSDPRGSPEGERAPHIDLNEIWGNLPPELRQKLISKNFDDFTPEYKEQIAEYFKKTSTVKKP